MANIYTWVLLESFQNLIYILDIIIIAILFGDPLRDFLKAISRILKYIMMLSLGTNQSITRINNIPVSYKALSLLVYLTMCRLKKVVNFL